MPTQVELIRCLKVMTCTCSTQKNVPKECKLYKAAAVVNKVGYTMGCRICGQHLGLLKQARFRLMLNKHSQHCVSLQAELKTTRLNIMTCQLAAVTFKFSLMTVSRPGSNHTQSLPCCLSMSNSDLHKTRSSKIRSQCSSLNKSLAGACRGVTRSKVAIFSE